MTQRPTMPAAAAVSALVSLGALTAAAAFVRWSLWWPHADMRQIWASGGTVLAGAVALAAGAVALARLGQRRRRMFIVLAGVCVLAGAVGGFALLRAMTEWAR